MSGVVLLKSENSPQFGSDICCGVTGVRDRLDANGTVRQLEARHSS
jgi:hypothetical protein